VRYSAEPDPAAAREPTLVDPVRVSAAVAGEDFLPTRGTLHFPPGSARQTFQVWLLQDPAVFDGSASRPSRLQDGTKAVRLTLSDAAATSWERHARVGPGSGAGQAALTILDEEAAKAFFPSSPAARQVHVLCCSVVRVPLTAFARQDALETRESAAL
jgi:hypothetical protein